MTLEDYTTYTEDDPNARFTVAANKIDFDGLIRTDDGAVTKDKGAGHFGDFEHLLEVKIDSETGTDYSHVAFWATSNDDALISEADLDAATTGINFAVSDKFSASLTRWRLFDRHNGTNDYMDLSITTARSYIKVKRDGLTLTLYVYSDAARTVLVGSENCACDADTYRYIYAIMGMEAGSNSRSITGEVNNLDLQELETHTPSDTAKSSDALTFKAEVPIEDTAKASDSISFFKGLRFAIGDTAKASDALTFAAEINITDTAKASDLFSTDIPAPLPCECSTFTLHGTFTAILFPKPEWANPNNSISKNVDLFNFRGGDLDTVDRGIDAQPLTIGGIIYFCGDGNWQNTVSITTWLNSIKNAMNNGETFMINELGDCLNGVYVIRDFVFDTIKGTPDGFRWSLYLERVKDI